MNSVKITAGQLHVGHVLCRFGTDEPMGRVESVSTVGGMVTFKDDGMTYPATVGASTVFYVQR